MAVRRARGVYVATAVFWLLGSTLACSDDPETAARRLHAAAIVVDTHSDTTPRFEDPSWRFAERHDARDGDMDLPRIREGGLDVEFFSIYMGKTEGDGAAIKQALERIDAVHEMVRAHPGEVVLAGSVDEIRRAVAAGRFVALMGIEGGHIIEESLPALRMFYALGVRYMTLTHSFHTSWADSSGTRDAVEPAHGGLTDFGREVVLEMNRLGMMVDVSHVADATFEDVIEVSRAPVIASHSSVRAIAKHRRNMSDAMLESLAARGGVVMINFYPGYIDDAANEATKAWYARNGAELKRIFGELAEGPERRAAYRALIEGDPAPTTSLSVLLDHFDHAIAVAGPDHVGLGADWDGVASMPEGLEDVSMLPALTRDLLERGHSQATVRKVLGENLLRVMDEVERVAEQLAGAAGGDGRVTQG